MLGSWGEVDYILGLDVNLRRIDDEVEIELSLRSAVEILIENHCPDATIISTPADKKVIPKPTDEPSPEEIEAQSKFPYQSIVGALLYISISARPDISFAVGACASHNQDYRSPARKAVI